MIPIRDTVRSHSFSLVNWALIGANTFVFLMEARMAPAAQARLITTFGLVPARLDLLNPLQWISHPQPLLTLFTHMFLHGGWLHFLSNIWVLYIFGDNVEDRMGPGRYLLFYLASGLFAGLTQAVVDLTSTTPAIGASGAIAGVLGAYLILFPKSRVITLIPLFFIPWFVELPSVIFLGFWFVTQLISGLSSLWLPGAAHMGGVAFWAHIGGFLFGMIFFRLFTPRRHVAYYRNYTDEHFPW